MTTLILGLVSVGSCGGEAPVVLRVPTVLHVDTAACDSRELSIMCRNDRIGNFSLSYDPALPRGENRVEAREHASCRLTTDCQVIDFELFEHTITNGSENTEPRVVEIVLAPCDCGDPLEPCICEAP